MTVAAVAFIVVCTSLLIESANGIPINGEQRPSLTLQFTSKMRLAMGYGHNGDGCPIANATIHNASATISLVWFDAPGKRLAQTNPGYFRVDPNPKLVVIGHYEDHPPTELDIQGWRPLLKTIYPNPPTLTLTGLDLEGDSCFEEPLPPTYCNNGSRVCPPVFGGEICVKPQP